VVVFASPPVLPVIDIVPEVDTGSALRLWMPPRPHMMAGRIEERAEPHLSFASHSIRLLVPFCDRGTAIIAPPIGCVAWPAIGLQLACVARPWSTSARNKLNCSQASPARARAIREAFMDQDRREFLKTQSLAAA